MEDLSLLKFRRQYIFSAEKIKKIDNWKKITILFKNNEWHLHYHPDLEVTHIISQEVELILIGYLIDPDNQYDNNFDILEIIAKNKTLLDIIKSTDKFCGRFVIIYKNKDELNIFSDATSFREVYYTSINSKMSIGATPNILAETFNISKEISPDMNSFINSKSFNFLLSFWIGYETLYKNVYKLPPNHYLNLLNGSVIRFWPYNVLKKIDINKATLRCTNLLKGYMENAVRRYKIHMGMSAGWDTRVLLSASKNVIDNIFFYMIKASNVSEKSSDIRISKKIADKFDFNLNIIDLPDFIDNDFKTFYYGNNSLAREYLLSAFYDAFKKKLDNTVTVSGVMGNGGARINLRIPKGSDINGATIAKVCGYGGVTYAIEQFNIWYNKVGELCNNFKIDIMDLWESEHEYATWAALSASEQDIVREEIRPFNSRELISLFISIDDKYRYQYNPIVFKRIINKLWKDLLKIPVNPSFKSTFKKILRRLYIEKIMFKVYRFLNFKY